MCPLSAWVTPGISRDAHAGGENLVLLCINVFFWHFGICSLPVAGLFSCSRLRGTQGACPDLARKFGPWPRSASTCSGGSKWQVPSGRDSEHVEPARCMQTQEQVKRMSDGSCDIWDLECHQSMSSDLLGDGKVFPRHQHARHSTTFSTIR